MEATCLLCQPPAVIADGIIEHLYLSHPDALADFLRWPDGAWVVEDQTLEPSDFTAGS